MRKIIDIAINDLIVFFRDPGAIIGVLVIPIVFSIVFADLRTANSALVLCPFDNNEDDFCRLDDHPALTEERSVSRLSENTALALIIIPEGFEADLAANEPVSIVYRSNENAAAPSYILQAVQAVVGRMSGAQVAATVGVSIVENSGGI
jgi:hypothetical protein